MRFQTASAPHLVSADTVSVVMRRVLIALIPGIALLTAFFGVGVLSNLVLATAFALLFETAALSLRRWPLRPFLTDYSVVVTAWLLAAALPPLSPWWLIAVATGFAVIVAKHLYGGLGYNPFNPAMVGYVVVLISFPAELTAWLAPAGLGESPPLFAGLASVFTGGGVSQWDGATAATVLDVSKTEVARGRMLSEISAQTVFGVLGGRGWEWANLAFLLGGLWMLYRRVIHWHIPTGMLGSLMLLSGLFWIVDSETFGSPLFHLFGGATLLGAFFIATDPVSAATTPRGRLLFGAGIGILTFAIRTWGGYPDGVAFAVLLMNMVAPTLDYYTQPRVFGHGRG